MVKWLDSLISAVSPTWGTRREVARLQSEAVRRRVQRLSALREWEAIGGDRTRYDMLGTSKSVDAFVATGIKELRQQIRYLEMNNAFVSGPIKRIVNNVVGLGIRFQSRISADESYFAPGESTAKIRESVANQLSDRAEKLFKEWMEQADIRMIQSFFEIQRTTIGALVRDGEALVIGRSSNRPGRLVPFCLQVIEIDRLQTPLDQVANPKIQNGIEYDDEGCPAFYWVMKRHPGSTHILAGTKAEDYERIPAFNPNGTRKVFHLFDIMRPEQSRGFPPFAPGMKDFQDLDRYREAEILAALEDACMTGIVKTPAPDEWQGNYTSGTTEADEDTGTSERLHEFAPLKWHYMLPGEEVDIHKPNRPNEAMDSLVNHLLRGPANALDIPPEVFAQKWDGMNYSNSRTVLQQFYLPMKIMQSHLIKRFCQPVWENVAADLVVQGLMGADGAVLYDKRRRDFLVSAWIPPGWSWVDPVSEVQGKTIELNYTMTTLSEICASQGRDFDETVEARAKELVRMQQAEQKYGISFPVPQGQAGSTTMPKQEAEKEEGEKEEGNQRKKRDLQVV
ncbi:MAG TPA: phage portal protein [Thermodesulfobacteriota bacterium]|nr:phage portal protein [Thermodesulfobacteriota bacterium]HNU70861.1 phage portal protein [Thermodesulfobacteriota bacterium]